MNTWQTNILKQFLHLDAPILLNKAQFVHTCPILHPKQGKRSSDKKKKKKTNEASPWTRKP